MSRTCVFVDGGYFQKVLERDFDKARVDFALLGPELAHGYEPFLRMYYYNCLPYQGAHPTGEERQLMANARRFYGRLERIANLEVRLGRLAFRGRAENGEPIFEQKRVDVQLAVDLLTLAFSHQIATAVVVTGDSDFMPVFESAKNQGVRIALCYGVKNPAHRDLIAKADERVVLDDRFITNVRLA